MKPCSMCGLPLVRRSPDQGQCACLIEQVRARAHTDVARGWTAIVVSGVDALLAAIDELTGIYNVADESTVELNRLLEHAEARIDELEARNAKLEAGAKAAREVDRTCEGGNAPTLESVRQLRAALDALDD